MIQKIAALKKPQVSKSEFLSITETSHNNQLGEALTNAHKQGYVLIGNPIYIGDRQMQEKVVPCKVPYFLVLLQKKEV